jgi:membrane protein YdbS with pleckstrin-like domain
MDMIVKAIPAILAAIPLTIKLIKKFFENKKNTKTLLRSLGLSVMVLALALIILLFIMIIIYKVEPDMKTDKVNQISSISFTLFAYLTVISLAVKLNYKSKHSYTIAASSIAIQEQNDYILKEMDEQLKIISNRVVNNDLKIEGKLDYVENLDNVKEPKEVIIFRWLSIISWLVIPCSAIILIFNIDNTEYHVWYVNISILILSIIMNTLIIHSDVKLQEGKTNLTVNLGHKHVKQYRRRLKQNKSKKGK